MKISFRTGTAFFLIIGFFINPLLLAENNPIPGRWEKVGTTKAGAPIRIYTKDNAEQECRFESVDDRFLICTSGEDDKIQVELEMIDKVTLYKRGKYINWGGVLGLVGGAAYGEIWAIRSPGSEDEFLGVICMSVIGFVAGSLTGAVLGSPETIYISKEAALKKVRQ